MVIPQRTSQPMRHAARTMAVLFGLLLTGAPAAADGDQLDDANAEYRQSLAEMVAKSNQSACPAMLESYRRSKKPAALFPLAECEARWGKYATALAHYRAYLASFATMTPEQRARQGERKSMAIDQVGALQSVVPMIEVRLSASAPPGTRVQIDGKPADAGGFIPVDPGEHSIAVLCIDGTTIDETAVVTMGQRRVVTVQWPEAATPERLTTAPIPQDRSADTDGSATRALGMVLSGVGVAGLLAGTVTGALALSERETVLDNCVDSVCNAEGKDAADTTQTLGYASTVTFAAGGVALAAGLVLWLTAPGGKEPSAKAGAGLRLIAGGLPSDPSAATLGLGGSW